MKKIAMALALLLAAASCDFLDVVPEGSPTQDDIYKTQAQAEKMLFMVYGKCPDLFHAQAMPDLSGGDDLISSYYGSVRYFSWKSLVYATSQESPTNTYFNMWGTTSGLPTGNYSYNIYEGIRYAYNFLNNIGSVPDISEANLRYWSGEAHFLIAHLHQILLEYYGPIVLAREEIDLNAPASSVNVPRSTYDECVNFIEEEFRKAADMLPDYWGPIAYGRAIKATALAYFTAMSDKVYPAFAGVLGGQKPVLKVRSMTSCWGVCCPGKRQITFALQLYNQPPAAQIYVVVHEYCHFLQLNHSPAFWAEVEKLLPDWKARRELLKK